MFKRDAKSGYFGPIILFKIELIFTIHCQLCILS